MGERYAKSKPKKAVKQGKKKKTPISKMQFKGGNVFSEKFDETVLYRPKTQDNKVKYDNFLGRINSISEDYPQEILISLADEILAILKASDNQIEKKLNIEALLRDKISQ